MAFVPCQHCQGSGEIRHPRWGSYTCPEPTVECPECDGTGGYTTADFACDDCGDALRRTDAETEAMSA